MTSLWSHFIKKFVHTSPPIFQIWITKYFFSKDRRIWGGKHVRFVSKINFNFIIFFYFLGFHLKLPREVDPQEHSGSQSNKISSQSGEKPFQTSQIIERSSQGDPVDDENMITQTPLNTLNMLGWSYYYQGLT
jgi:hypothetical protein